MTTYFLCLAAYLTGWPLIQFLLWPHICKRFFAAREARLRKTIAIELVEVLKRYHESEENAEAADAAGGNRDI